MQIETRKIESLKEDPRNARKHGEKNYEAIQSSLEEFGQQKPIVIDKESQVIAGNGTLQAAKEIGWQEIKVVVSDLEGLRQTAFAIADNRTAELASWDDAILAESLEALSDLSFELACDTGFSDDEVRRILERASHEDLEVAPDWANTTVDDVEAGVNKVMLTFTAEEHEKFMAAIQTIMDEHGVAETTSAVIKAVEKATGHEIT